MKLCEIYDEGCSSLSFDYTCKIRDGTELEMETQSDTIRGGKSTKIFYSSKSTITLLKFYLSTSKSTSLKIYSSKSKK